MKQYLFAGMKCYTFRSSKLMCITQSNVSKRTIILKICGVAQPIAT